MGWGCLADAVEQASKMFPEVTDGRLIKKENEVDE